MLSQEAVKRIKKILRWARFLAKCAALGTAVSGAVTAFTTSLTTGAAMSAAGATGYAATSVIPGSGCERIRHVAPPRMQNMTLRSAAMNTRTGVSVTRSQFAATGRRAS